jgi:hypothetical protein
MQVREQMRLNEQPKLEQTMNRSIDYSGQQYPPASGLPPQSHHSGAKTKQMRSKSHIKHDADDTEQKPSGYKRGKHSHKKKVLSD